MKAPVRMPEPTPEIPDPVAQAIADLPPPPPPLCEVAQKECPWNPDMESAPRDGRTLLLTESLAHEDGIKARWYIALGQARPWKTAPNGWLNADTKQWVPFEPAGWAYVPRGW